MDRDARAQQVRREREEQERHEHAEHESQAGKKVVFRDGWYVGPLVRIKREGGIESITTGATGRRMIRGIAATPTISSKQRSFRSAGCQVKFPVPLLCAHHEMGQVGDVVLVEKGPERVIVHALFWQTEAARYAWDLVKAGEMGGLSMGTASVRKTVVDGVTFHERWLLQEVSIVRTPANPDCTFEVMRDE
jgi:hypothetical protein